MDSTLELFRALAAHHVDASALLQPRTPDLQQQGLISGGYGAGAASGWLQDVGAMPGLGAGMNTQLCHAPGDLSAHSLSVGAQLQPGMASLSGLDDALQQLALTGHPLLLQQQQQQPAQQPGGTLSALYQRPSNFGAVALNQINMTGPPQQQCMVARPAPFNLSAVPPVPMNDWQAGLVSNNNNVMVSSLLPSINGSAFLGLAGLPGTAQGMVLQPMQVPPLQQQQPPQQHDAGDTDLTPFGTAAAAGMVLAARGAQQQQEQGLATSQQALLQAALSHAAAANQLVAEAASAAGMSAPGLQVAGLLSSGGQGAGAVGSMAATSSAQQFALPGVASCDSISSVTLAAANPSPAGSSRFAVPAPRTPAATLTALPQAGVPRYPSSTNTMTSSGGSSVLSAGCGGAMGASAAAGLPRPGGSSLYLAHKQQQAQQRAAALATKAHHAGLKPGQQQLPSGAVTDSSLGSGRDSSGASPGAEGASQAHHRQQKSKGQQQQLQQAAPAARSSGPPPGLQQVDSASSAAGAGSYSGQGLVTTSSTNTDGGRGACPSSSSASGSQWLNKKLNVKLYKTELCHAWEEQGSCRYGAKCQFAHGSEELRPVERHPRYKTEVCRHFVEEGACPYGVRCRFIHPNVADGDAAAAAPAAPAPAAPEAPAAFSQPAAAVAAVQQQRQQQQLQQQQLLQQQLDNGQAAGPGEVRPRRLPVFQQLQVAPGSPHRCGLDGTGIGDDSDPFGTADSASSMACFLAANAAPGSPKQGEGGQPAHMGSFDLLGAAQVGPRSLAGALLAASGAGAAAVAAQGMCQQAGAESEGQAGASLRLGWEGLWR